MFPQPQRIFVRGPNWLGDVVMATPVLRSLRQHFPQAEVQLGLRPYALPLLEGTGLVDELVPLDDHGLKGIWRTSRMLRERKCDLGILLTNSFGSALTLAVAGIPRRQGYRGEGRSFLLTDPVEPLMEKGRRKPVPMAQFYGRIVEGLGCSLDDMRYELPVTAADQRWVDDWSKHHGLDPAEPWMALNPGAKFGSSKLWPAEHFAHLGDALHRDFHARLILLGGPGEEALLDSIEARMGAPCINTARNVIPLGPLRALMPRLALLVTTDTGPRAMAQAADLPHVVLMGPTHPGWTDLNNDKAAILRLDVDCGPCHRKICPLDHRCMTGLLPESALEAAHALLGC